MPVSLATLSVKTMMEEAYRPQEGMLHQADFKTIFILHLNKTKLYNIFKYEQLFMHKYKKGGSYYEKSF
ncbi:hypothetical protein XI25_01625 [Paenibacillus sp. DMB20]|nr:hypothetical protein XI25_01625 [Paenibacillus sp. DMB20]